MDTEPDRQDDDGRFRVVFRPTAVVLIGTYLAAGLLIGVGATAAAGTVAQVLTIASEFTLLALGGVIGHELGHAGVALVLGRPVRALIIKLGAGVLIDEPEDRLGGVLVALGGPAASLVIALVYLSLGNGTGSAATWAGVLALADAAANLVPLTRTADGARALAALSA